MYLLMGSTGGKVKQLQETLNYCAHRRENGLILPI